MTPSIPSLPAPLSERLLRRPEPQEAREDRQQALRETASVTVTSGPAPALRLEAPSGRADSDRAPAPRDTKWAGLRSPWKASMVMLLLGAAAVKSGKAGIFSSESTPPGRVDQPVPPVSPYDSGTVVTRMPALTDGSSYIELSGTNGTDADAGKPSVSGGVSPSTTAALTCLSLLGAIHTIPAWLSHSTLFPAGPWRNIVCRQESLFSENVSVRGIVQMYTYANLAVPGALKPNATEAQQAKWATAAVLGFNARMFIETLESAYVFPDRPGSALFDALKHKLSSPTEPLRHLFPISSLVGLPLVAKKMDESQAMKEFNRLIGWGAPAGDSPGFVAPRGFSNQEGLLWFQTRFHLTALLSEMFNLYGTLESGKNYTLDNGLCAALNVWAGPQVGALGVTATQLIPIIGRINALQHGTAGPGFLRDLAEYQAARYVIYALATPLLTLPQYDFVMTLMANVPNGKGIHESGIAACIQKFGRPCVGGPTSLMYEVSGQSPLAFVPLAVSAAAQLALMLYLKNCASAARVAPEGKSQATASDRTDYIAVELATLTPSKLDVKATAGYETPSRTVFMTDTKGTPSQADARPDSSIASPSRLSPPTGDGPASPPKGEDLASEPRIRQPLIGEAGDIEAPPGPVSAWGAPENPELRPKAIEKSQS